jgi:hypothetical protein
MWGGPLVSSNLVTRKDIGMLLGTGGAATRIQEQLTAAPTPDGTDWTAWITAIAALLTAVATCLGVVWRKRSQRRSRKR